MHPNMISWQDYEGVEGFGVSNQDQLDQLQKALVAGADRDPPGSVVSGDGFALRTESLERTLKNVTFKAEHIRLFKDIAKAAAYNTVEEYNVVHEYGDNPDSGWIEEGALPNEDDSTYERKVAKVKYLGTVRKVSHVMSLVRPAHGNVIAQQTIEGTLHLLRILERALFFGDSSLSDLQFDGFEKLITDNAPAANIIDLRGRPLSEDMLIDGALTIQDAPNYGTPTDLYSTPKVKADLVKTFFPKERYDLMGKDANGMVGLDIRGFDSPAGPVSFQPDVFITDGGAAPSSAKGDATKRPASPTISTGATTPVEATALFTADDAGDYYYKIVAVNQYGQSTSVAVGGGAITVAAGDKVTFGVTPGSAIAVDYYKLYRTKVDGASGTERLILRIPNTAGAGELTVNDLNESLPYTTSAFLFQQNGENMALKQLAPMVKIPLATIDTSIRWAQLIYCVPMLYTPGKNVLFKNVGRAEGYVGQS